MRPSRRQALALMAGALALPGCAVRPAAAPPVAAPATPAAAPAPPPAPEPPTAPPAAEPLALVKPPRLRPGDVVGLFASATRMTEPWIAGAMATVTALGLRPRLAPNVRAVHGHYAGTVAQRVDDLHTLWADPEVRALWSIRGGAGSAQLLPHLDYAAMRREPKALLGFSDVTALQLALLRHAGLVSFHTIAAHIRPSAHTLQSLQAVLMAPRAGQVLERAPQHRQRGEAEAAYRARTVRGGLAEGPLVGGNLSVLSALVGTPWAPQTEGALLFLEDVGELPYRIDRMLTQLEQAGLSGRAAGIAGGIFRDCEHPPDQPGMPLSQPIDERFGAAGVPAVYGLSFGHVQDQVTLPLGVRARLDADALTLTLLETAVS